MIDIIGIINRIKTDFELKDDKDVAVKLGVSQQSLTNWKNREKIPYKELISFCLEQNLNMKYILTGEKEENYINFKEEINKMIDELEEKQLEETYYFVKNKKLNK